jgi:hypothetical protein
MMCGKFVRDCEWTSIRLYSFFGAFSVISVSQWLIVSDLLSPRRHEISEVAREKCDFLYRLVGGLSGKPFCSHSHRGFSPVINGRSTGRTVSTVFPLIGRVLRAIMLPALMNFIRILHSPRRKPLKRLLVHPWSNHRAKAAV